MFLRHFMGWWTTVFARFGIDFPFSPPHQSNETARLVRDDQISPKPGRKKTCLSSSHQRSFSRCNRDSTCQWPQTNRFLPIRWCGTCRFVGRSIPAKRGQGYRERGEKCLVWSGHWESLEGFLWFAIVYRINLHDERIGMTKRLIRFKLRNVWENMKKIPKKLAVGLWWTMLKKNFPCKMD